MSEETVGDLLFRMCQTIAQKLDGIVGGEKMEPDTDWRMSCQYCGEPLAGNDYRICQAIEWLSQERYEISPRRLAICLASDAEVDLYEQQGEAEIALSAAFDYLFDLDADDLCAAVQHLRFCTERPAWLRENPQVYAFRDALEQIALLADATEPVSVAMAAIAMRALGAGAE